MRIAHILPSLAYAGPILISQSIVNELTNKGIYIDVYYFDNKVETKFNTNVFRIDFFKRIDFDKYDIIHSHMLRPDLYVFFWSLLGKCKNTKKVSTIHQFIDHDLRIQHSFLTAKLASFIWHEALKTFDTIIALNSLMQNTYINKYPHKKIAKIHNGVTLSYTKEKADHNDVTLIQELKTKYTCLGAAAQITRNKGFHQIIKLLEKNNSLCFILIGEGPELMNLKHLAGKAKVANRILFLGKKNNARRYFILFDIFIMASEMEGFPVALLEAASQSVPAVCPKNEIFTGMFNSDEISFFERENISSLNNAINLIIKNHAKYSTKIFNRFKNSYTAEHMASKYLQLYNSILETNK